jgi:DUF971 family protein
VILPRPQGPSAAIPVELRKRSGGASLAITWADGHTGEYAAVYLRGHCPCAHCVDESTGHRKVGPLHIVPDVSLLKIVPVGNYAVQLEWSDGHRTGLYSFEYLRSLCPCPECAAA